jgi:hypothetical protein
MFLYDFGGGRKEESSVGIKLLYLNNNEDANESVDGKIFKGLILDKKGLGIINGLDSVVNGKSHKNFVRKDVTIYGLSHEETKYSCSAPEDSRIYAGTIVTPKSQGIITFYPDDIKMILIHRDLSEYYTQFMKQDFMKEEH